VLRSAGVAQDVQRKIGITLAAKSMASLKFEEFLALLNLLNSVCRVARASASTYAGKASVLRR
jgi:hypothetical protein